jgi:hypothetical protein
MALATAILAGCGSDSQRLASDARRALSAIDEAAFLAHEGAAGRLTPGFRSARAEELAVEAQEAASALDQDRGHEADRRRLADSARRASSLLSGTDDHNVDATAFDALAREAAGAAHALGA